MIIQRSTVNLLFSLKDKTDFRQLEILQTHINNMSRNTLGPIGSPQAMAYEPSMEDPAYATPEQESPDVDPDREFAAEMTAFFINHPGPYEVDSMVAVIEKVKKHYGIK